MARRLTKPPIPDEFKMLGVTGDQLCPPFGPVKTFLNEKNPLLLSIFNDNQYSPNSLYEDVSDAELRDIIA